VCERIQVLDFGKPLALGKPEEIRTNPDVITAYLGVKGAKLAQEHHGA
jgi:branched-chain amino acid transport system ATP-binding protein